MAQFRGAVSLSRAVDAGFVNKEFFGESHDDFVMSVDTLPVPAETSWLTPGAVFSGSQHATTPTTLSCPVSSSNGGTSTAYRLTNGDSYTPSTLTSGIPRPGFDPSRPFDTARPWSSHTPTYIPRYDRTDRHTQDYPVANSSGSAASYPPQQQERWPVKVTVHQVDYENMTLAATMEAYNVPSHSSSLNIITAANGIRNVPSNRSSVSSTSPTHLRRPSPSPEPNATHASSSSRSPRPGMRTSSITTYLEGEILDFRQHALLTESFPSTPGTDATYWRKLEPFAGLSDDEVVRKLVSKEWMRWLGENYVLMRWKERCFVNKKPGTNANDNTSTISSALRTRAGHGEEEMQVAADGCGLTISGFYYVCLKRRDGSVEGLYCDPQSSPYQHLKLESVGRGSFPVWEFR